MQRAPEPISTRRVDPDPSITSAIGRHHSLSTAITDLVDNALDAGAGHVSIRFVLAAGRPVSLVVIDDGCGMDDASIDTAMTYARRRDYDAGDLGHFGIGLKAASLSQADVLRVWSRRFGAPAVGRGLRRETLDTGPLVESYATADACERLDTLDPGFALPTGTIVEWLDVRAFLSSPNPIEQTEWLETTVRHLRTHLGVTLHRILARGTLVVTIEEFDEDYGAGVPRTVEPIDPFPAPQPGTPAPDDLTLKLPNGVSSACPRLWPAHRRSDPGFALGGRSPLDSQGLYVYRHDRLLQAGGWNGLVSPSPDLGFARVSVDLDDVLEPHLTVNPEKAGVTIDATLSEAFHNACTGDGSTFADFLDEARTGARESRRRRRHPVTLVEPVSGLPPAVIVACDEETEFDPAEQPIDIRWSFLRDDEVFRVDKDARKLSLNQTYREQIVGAPSRDPHDAPVVKTLLLLLLSDHFRGPGLGISQRQHLDAWQQILLAAVRTQPAVNRPPGGVP